MHHIYLEHSQKHAVFVSVCIELETGSCDQLMKEEL